VHVAKNTLLRKAIEGNDKWMSVTPQLEAENLWFFVDEDVKVRTQSTSAHRLFCGGKERRLRGDAGGEGRGGANVEPDILVGVVGACGAGGMCTRTPPWR
jgi:hypothetical protein